MAIFNSFLYDQRVTEPQDHIELDLGSAGFGLGGHVSWETRELHKYQ
jgi:hypothetical protein